MKRIFPLAAAGEDPSIGGAGNSTGHTISSAASTLTSRSDKQPDWGTSNKTTPAAASGGTKRIVSLLSTVGSTPPAARVINTSFDQQRTLMG